MGRLEMAKILLDYLQLESEFRLLLESLASKPGINTLPPETAALITKIRELRVEIVNKQSEFIDEINRLARENTSLGIIMALDRANRTDLLDDFPQADELHAVLEAEKILGLAGPLD